MNKEIEIPEGYEARIEGNKIILELKESNDEKIRKWLIDYFGKVNDEIVKEDRQKIITYLERQKEQKPASGNSEKPNNHAGWSEEEKMHLANAILAAEKEWGINSCTAKFLKSLRPSWNSSEEQPEVDLEKEIDKYFALWRQGASDEGCVNANSQFVSLYDCTQIARHFAEWGATRLNARKEE